MQPQTNIREQQRFPLGETFITPGAEEALMMAGQTAIEFLRRHMSLERGELSDEDARENELSLCDGFRVLSAFRTVRGQRLYGSSRRPTVVRPLFSRRTNIDRNWKQRGASASRTRAHFSSTAVLIPIELEPPSL